MTSSQTLARRLVLLAALGLASGAAARELSWRALEVDARLESDGTLVISELQRMRFDGDWNGGERTFRLEPGQRLRLDRIVRLAGPTGPERELVRGDLSEVDHWDWSSSKAVRWRSRRASDPPFAGTELDYRLDYRLTGALVAKGAGRFSLAHDFAFADRDGVIERVLVYFTLDPTWRAISPLPERFEGGPLPPGHGFVVQAELEYTGAGTPALAAPSHLPGLVIGAVLLAMLVGYGVLIVGFRSRERELGRFAPLPAVESDAWLEEKVFSIPPEVVGAAWDRSVAAPEVAAMLARLTQEGKLASSVESRGRIFRTNDLKLRLLVKRTDLTETERSLIDALFGDQQETDTRAIRARYSGSGFDPASRIRSGVETRLAQLRGFSGGSPRPSRRPTLQLLLAGLVLLGFAAIALAPSRLPALVLVPALLVLSIPGFIAALVGQSRVHGLGGPAVGIALSFLLQLLVVAGFARWPDVSLVVPLGGACLALALARSILNLLTTRESREGLARRRELVAARLHCARQLKESAPKLEDRWFPYLLAFGLAPQMDRWFRAFGDRATTASASTWTSSSASSGGSGGFGGGGWSGGGGAFGGAGATATWAMAATAMSAGVPSPSSSSGGGGGGGGSSSGGGGGGGW